MPKTEEILALPLWINGHAYLTMAPAFFDVRDARSGEIRRRTPLCGALETQAAIDAAVNAAPAWSAAPKAAQLTALAEALARYRDHFADLLAEESGLDAAHAASEVDEATRALRATTGGPAPGGVVAIIGDFSAPFLAPLRHAIPVLLAGATVVVKPSPKAPSALFALAELTARCGFPGGVFNILHGDLAAVEALCANPLVTQIRVAGDPMLGASIAAIATRHGKPFVA